MLCLIFSLLKRRTWFGVGEAASTAEKALRPSGQRAGTRHVHLQRRRECLREGQAVGAGADAVGRGDPSFIVQPACLACQAAGLPANQLDWLAGSFARQPAGLAARPAVRPVSRACPRTSSPTAPLRARARSAGPSPPSPPSRPAAQPSPAAASALPALPDLSCPVEAYSSPTSPSGKCTPTPCHPTSSTKSLLRLRRFLRWLLLAALVLEFPVDPSFSYSSPRHVATGLARQWARALALLREAADLQLQPNVFTYSAVISACSAGLEWQRALALWDEMGRVRVAPNLVTYSAAISARLSASGWRAVGGLVGAGTSVGLIVGGSACPVGRLHLRLLRSAGLEKGNLPFEGGPRRVCSVSFRRRNGPRRVR